MVEQKQYLFITSTNFFRQKKKSFYHFFPKLSIIYKYIAFCDVFLMEFHQLTTIYIELSNVF